MVQENVVVGKREVGVGNPISIRTGAQTQIFARKQGGQDESFISIKSNREAAAAIRQKVEKLTPANVREYCMQIEEIIRNSMEKGRLPPTFISVRTESEAIMRQMQERTHFEALEKWAQSMQSPNGRINHPMTLMVAQLVAKTIQDAGETQQIYGKTRAQWTDDIRNLVNGVAQAVETFGGNGQGAKQ